MISDTVHQSCERIRTSLECMEVYKDLDTFVQKRRTGQTPPGTQSFWPTSLHSPFLGVLTYLPL